MSKVVIVHGAGSHEWFMGKAGRWVGTLDRAVRFNTRDEARAELRRHVEEGRVRLSVADYSECRMVAV